MRIRKISTALALGVAALGLSACATGLNTKVSRYQPAAIPAGQSFYVVPEQGQAGAEFYHYATMVSQQLQAQGYRPLPEVQSQVERKILEDRHGEALRQIDTDIAAQAAMVNTSEFVDRCLERLYQQARAQAGN
jgi:hypothetical protein